MPTTARQRPGNLPGEVSSFVGRRRDVGEVKRRLTEARLVTLTGVGGVGKTRLGLRVAAEVQRAFPHGVWFVDLTQLREPTLLTQEVQNADVLAYLVMAALGVRERGGGAPLQVLAEQLADRRMLLVLDNCEHLVPASAILAHTLLRGCPGLRILATSREPLAIAGETLFPVPPLSVPGPHSRPSLAEPGRYEALDLFVARAEAARPGFALTEDDRDAVAQLCYRLDGLPLAIELAAARIRVLAPQQILDRLADRFGLLGRGSRSAPVRQQTLRACVDWSFDLCSKPERVLWARLSVFVGGFELDAVEGVCADELLPAEDLLDLVAGLVDKSVLISEDVAGVVRYRMLETLRDHGRNKLREADEEAALRRRQRDWHERLAACARAEWISDQQPYWMARLGREHANLRAVIDYCATEPGEAAAALRLLMTLPSTYWWVCGQFGEARQWLERALAQVGADLPTALHVRALRLAATLALNQQGDFSAADRLLDQAHDLAQALNSPELARVLLYRGTAALFRGELPTALDLHEQALTLVSSTPQPDLESRFAVLLSLGMVAGMVGDHSRVEACCREVLALTEPVGEIYYRAQALWLVAVTAWRQGRFAEAADRARDGLRLRRISGMRDRTNIAMSLDALAWIAASQRQYPRAATLLGAADGVRRDVGMPIHASWVRDHDTCLRQVREVLGNAAFTAAFDHGQGLPDEAALDYALDERSAPEPARPQPVSTPLTRRERQIADLIAQGMSNKEIASRLVISQRTAESHVEHILTKLGFSSRTQVAAWQAAPESDDQGS